SGWRASAERAPPGERASWPASPIRTGGRGSIGGGRPRERGPAGGRPARRPGGSRGGALGPRPVGLGEDFLVLGESEGHRVIEDHGVVDGHGEDPSHAFLQLGGDAVLGLDGGLQTGGLWEIVSLAAVGDLDLHPILLWIRLAAYDTER